MTIKKIEAGRVITQNIDEFIGTRGTIWYDENTGEMRLYDGTPGGKTISGGGGGGNGYTGSKGDLGYTGSQGVIGYDGSQGYTGSKGDLGYTGSQGVIGYDGSQGYTGSKGDLGYTGSYGDLGFTGSRGDTGFVGSQGDRGDQGLTGAQGVSVTLQGSTSTVAGLPPIGNPGDGWIVNDSGDLYFWNIVDSAWNNVGQIVGPQGDQGFTGSQGDVGFVGSRGETGYDGSRGERGYDGSAGYTGSYGDLGYTGSQGVIGYDGSQGYTGSQGDLGYTGSQGVIGYDGSQGYTGSIGYTGSGIIGLRSNNTDTVTLVSGFKFIPEDNKIQDLGAPDNRFGKIYLAGQTIFLGDTILSVADDGELQLLKPSGELEKIAVSSLKLGSTGTDGVVFSATGGVLSILSTVTNFTNIATTGTITVSSSETSTSTTTGALVISGGVGIGGDISLAGKIISDVVNINGTNGVIIATSGSNFIWAFNSDGTTAFPYYTFPASTGTAGQILVDLAGDGNLSWQDQTGGGGTGQAYDQVLFTTSSVTFANITIAPGGGITFPTGAPQTSRAPKMVVDQDFIDAPDYDAFFATLIPGDFYWSVTYSQIKILVDFGGYYDWQDLTVYAA